MCNKKTRQGYINVTPSVTVYPVEFVPPFSYPPRSVRAELQLGSETGEFLMGGVLKESITQDGALIVISGNPTETSDGSRFFWQAKL